MSPPLPLLLLLVLLLLVPLPPLRHCCNSAAAADAAAITVSTCSVAWEMGVGVGSCGRHRGREGGVERGGGSSWW